MQSARYMNVREPNGKVHRLDLSAVKCGAKTRGGKICNAHPAENGEMDITTDSLGHVKITGRCGTHINRDQGDDYRDDATDVPAR